MIKITDSAYHEIKKILYQKKSDSYLRIGVRKVDGCDKSYFLGIAASPLVNDEIIHIKEIKLVIHRDHLIQMEDLELDYLTEVSQSGFFFRSVPSGQCHQCPAVKK